MAPKMMNFFAKSSKSLTDITISGILALEVSTDIDIMIGDSSPKRSALVVTGRDEGFVDTEYHRGINIRLVIESDGPKK